MPPRIASILPAPLPLRDGLRVLEIGTGDGTTILQIAQWGAELGVTGRYVGVDRDPSRAGPFRASAAAAGVGDTATFARADAFCLGSALGRFDVLVSVDCLSQFVFEGLPAGVGCDAVEQRLTDMLAHWRTVLEAGGLLVVADTDRESAGDPAARAIAVFERERWPLLPGAVIDAALRAAGFASLRTRSTLRQRSGSRDDLERFVGGGAYRRLPRGNFPPPPYPPREVAVADGIHELAWRVVQASVPAEDAGA